MSINLPHSLKLSATVRNEWRVRCIADVIPQLDGAQWDVSVFSTDLQTVRDILADADFMGNPRNVDTYPAERAAYRALAKQCRAILSTDPSGPR